MGCCDFARPCDCDYWLRIHWVPEDHSAGFMQNIHMPQMPFQSGFHMPGGLWFSRAEVRFSQDFTIWFQKMSTCCRLFVLSLVPYKAMCTPIVREREKMSSQCTSGAWHSPKIPYQSPTDMGSSNWIVRLWRKSRIFECSNASWRTSAHAWWQILLRRHVVQPELQGNPRLHKTNVHIAWLHVALSYCMMIVELHLNMQWICPQWILLRHLLI